jgi:glycosyltransferase involved in cell wall biosynthesis
VREGHAAFAHVHEIVGGLRRRGYEVVLLAPSYGNDSVPPPVWRRLLEYVRLQAALAFKLSWCDVVYIRAHYMAVPTALLASAFRRIVVHEINGHYDEISITYPWTRHIRGLLRRMVRFQFRHADGLIAVTKQLKTWVVEDLGARIDVEVIPNGANIAYFRPGATGTYDVPRPYAVFFGSLARWQGIETLVTAVAHRDWPRHVSLVILGDGQERTVVQRAAAENSNLIWLGRVDYAKVPGVVAAALCSLVPKNSRGNYAATGLNPIKLFESLAAGVPVVVTDFPGQADLVREIGAGLVIPPNDPAALAAAVAKLAADPVAAAAMGHRGAEAIRAQHSWHERASATAAFIERLRHTE